MASVARDTARAHEASAACLRMLRVRALTTTGRHTVRSCGFTPCSKNPALYDSFNIARRREVSIRCHIPF